MELHLKNKNHIVLVRSQVWFLDTVSFEAPQFKWYLEKMAVLFFLVFSFLTPGATLVISQSASYPTSKHDLYEQPKPTKSQPPLRGHEFAPLLLVWVRDCSLGLLPLQFITHKKIIKNVRSFS